METIINSIPGYRVYEYLLVLSPHEDLRNRVMKVKGEFAEKYKTDNAGRGNPYITLVNFSQYAMMEERIITRLHHIAMGFPPFKLELKDFGSFPSHTIYINITSKLPVQSLVKKIRTEGQRLMKLNPDYRAGRDDNKPHFIMEPHLTIARKLKPWQYEKGWLEYSHKHFTGRFIANEMTLLKRPAVESTEGYRMKYQVAATFQFQNLPVATKQGELFG